MRPSSFISLFSVAACLLPAATLSAQRIISMNIAFAQTGNTAIDPDHFFGVPELGSVVTNWNNESWNKETLRWDDGSMSTVGMDVAFRNNRDYFGPGYINTPLNYGVPHYAATPFDPGTGLDFYNLDENFPEGYFVIVYVSGFRNNTGGFVSNGRQRFYYQTPDNNQTQLTPETLIRTTVVTDPGAGNYPEAHYAVFGGPDAPFTTPFLSIRIGHISGGGIALGGVQIVSVADPVVVDPTWAGYAIEGAFVYTGELFIGWLWTGAGNDWLYSVSTHQWVYATEDLVNAGVGGWVYFSDSSHLEAHGTHPVWTYSEVLKTWVAGFGEDFGTGPAWAYVIDAGL